MKQPQKWKRLGFQDEPQYRAACAATRQTRKAALLATRATLTHKHVLAKMWDRADFHQPVVTVTRENLMADIGCSLDTIKRAWRELKAEGSIKPIRNALGGRTNAVTFRLRVPHRPDAEQPIEQFAEDLKEQQDREAAWRFLKAKYGPIEALKIMDERGETPPGGAV